MANKILGGQRLSHSNFSFTLLPLFLILAAMPLSMETTQVLSKAGGNGGTEIKRSMKFFGGSTDSFLIYPTLSTWPLHTFQAPPTHQTIHLRGYTNQSVFFSSQSAFQQNFTLSSLTPQNHFPSQKSASCTMGNAQLQPPKSSTENSSDCR